MKSSLLASLFLILLVSSSAGRAATPTETAVPDTGWRLWLDPKAPWQNDTLYLPDEVHLETIPNNPPTGGWEALSSQAGIAVSLPGTVEEHYWGQAPANVLTPTNPSTVVKGNGLYTGVSWWYRTFTPPALKPGERLVFRFPGARMRAEVYVNGTLVGYDVVTETPFLADATAALKPGQPNLLAVRITNPGGNFSWGDYSLMKWGKYDIPLSHGFGGLNGGITQSIQGAVAVTDLAVLNHPDPHTITFTAEVTSTGSAYDGPMTFTIRQKGKTIWSGEETAHIAAGGTATITKTVTVPATQLWDIGKPNLYTATAALPSIAHSDRSTTFGFRWFTAEGVGSDAKLSLNGRRFVVKSAISWGFWSPNGMFPDQAAADREVAAVRAFGLNAVQNHRHMPKPIVLDTFDRAGLLRYCEAGAGCFTYVDEPGVVHPKAEPVDTSGTGGEPTTFYNRYELAKVLAMIRAERSHPSALLWSLQNEATPNRYNPKIYYTLHQMRKADPSRIILLESGFSSHDQVWALPYSDELRIDNGNGSGWNDTHTAETSTGVYNDRKYISATDYLYHTTDKAEVSVWGEMATGASPDDHAAMARWYKQQNTPGYDRAAHEAIAAAYEAFLDHNGFRAAFPNASALFRATADKHYFSAAKMLENARICDLNDYLALSGWESTVEDNHSGLVDALRFPKTDPSPIRAAAAPDLLVVRAHHYVIARGDSAAIDVHLVNENVLSGDYTLALSAQDASGKTLLSESTPVSITGGETFAQVLKADSTFTPTSPGLVTISATLTAGKAAPQVLTRREQILVVETKPAPLTGTIAYVGSAKFGEAVSRQFGAIATPLAEMHGKVDTLVIDPTTGARNTWKETPNVDVKGVEEPGLFRRQYQGVAGDVARFTDLPNGPAQVTLSFADLSSHAPGERVFDVALNGQTVLKDFDIVREAGGARIGITKTFPVTVTDGQLLLSVPTVTAGQAAFAAVQITDARGHITRAAFRSQSYRDAAGTEWKPVRLAGFDWNTIPDDVLRRVREDGTRLIVLSNDKDCLDAQEAATALARHNVLTYSGMLGDSAASWLGRWYFGKKSGLLAGLPSDCVLDWPYQINAGNGLLIDAPGMDGVIGYGINHEPRLGLGAAIVPYGRGKIVLFCLSGLSQAFTEDSPEGIDPVTAKRLVYNSLQSPL